MIGFYVVRLLAYIGLKRSVSNDHLRVSIQFWALPEKANLKSQIIRYSVSFCFTLLQMTLFSPIWKSLKTICHWSRRGDGKSDCSIPSLPLVSALPVISHRHTKTLTTLRKYKVPGLSLKFEGQVIEGNSNRGTTISLVGYLYIKKTPFFLGIVFGSCFSTDIHPCSVSPSIPVKFSSLLFS